MRAHISRRAFLSAPLLFLSPPQEIAFITQPLLDILRWAQSPGAADPPQWRDAVPYDLARQQAKWSGQPNPDVEVERQLRLLQDRKRQDPATPLLSAVAGFADQILQGRDQFLATAVPHLRSYLPAGTSIEGAIALAPFLPNYAFSMNYTIVVSITDAFWANDPARLFNILIHELFHNGFIRHHQGESPAGAPNSAALRRCLLWAIQNEGLATYVAWRARPAQLALNDYRLLDAPDEVRRRFDLCRNFIRDLQPASDLPSLKDRFFQESNVQRVTYIVGAAMAHRIEQIAGLAKLLATIQNGPEAFLQAYRATTPLPELTL